MEAFNINISDSEDDDLAGGHVPTPVRVLSLQHLPSHLISARVPIQPASTAASSRMSSVAFDEEVDSAQAVSKVLTIATIANLY